MLILLLQIVYAHDFSNSSVIELDDKSFDAAIDQIDKSWFVIFYRPTCPHCQQVMPTWKKFADEYQGQYSQIGAVNWYQIYLKHESEKYYELASKMSINGVPTFILFTLQQQKYYFEGDRTKEQFYEFMVKNYKKGEIQESVHYQVSYINIWIALIFGISLIITVLYLFRNQENKEYQNVSQSQMVEMQETEFQI